ncbi:unnamed protein product (macronuclear) [Paramecium tetraurelia]|uniref:HTH myb-type domain-containing protein n=1 Tax=Paramecium tetraurelia TaxID=5888 RepID=A0D5J7_PARTE|nr:uncharacterized protein GSPATT00013744001 [Paramecium tetraurelia]CAK78314.1 unnamed protein product [Paramecium tetraurelia]|eukprot:XP_001445711.1 hypothetical protein (macronuclear) [Paramecium tetraurelia strain d4-2]
MQDCKDEQNYLNFLQLEKTVGSIDDNSTSLHQLNHENLSLTYNMNQEVSPLNHQTKRIKKKKRVIFHYKKKRRNTKLIEMNNNNPFTVEEDQKILSLVLKHGPKFGNIIKNFNDRNQNAIKNRYYKYLRFRWDSILGSDYRRLNCKRDSEKVDCSDLTQIIDEMTIFPEFKDLLSQLVYRVHSYFN